LKKGKDEKGLPSTVVATTAAGSAPTFSTAARHVQMKARKLGR